MKERINYGLDAPEVVQRLALFGAAALTIGLVAAHFSGTSQSGWLRQVAGSGQGTGIMLLGVSAVMLWGSKFGKLRLRDATIRRLHWRGDEQVLDVGCGHGLMLIAAAKRLTTGHAVGIDLWQQEDQARNSAEATRRNLKLAKVEGVAEVRDGDATCLPFQDTTFDVILSSWALHNIYEKSQRQLALQEIWRVLKPGGKIAIIDIRHTAEYARQFAQLGYARIRRKGPNFLFVTPTFTVLAEKPLSCFFR
ncbi:MAG: class I SAM-dependent methyltransferase [Verrucomicrobiota bacterium]|nr:class I SAM-dependent methyltransferase [Verrucomicrobiota bacterium]